MGAPGEAAIDLVASDHSPCPPAMKRLAAGDIMTARGGIASLEVALAALGTGARARGRTPADPVRWMAGRPARLAGLAGRKGRITPGADADRVVWDAEAEWTVTGADLQHRHPLTPYEGRRLTGLVRATLVRGLPVFEREGRADDPGRFAAPPSGRLLARQPVVAPEVDRRRASG